MLMGLQAPPVLPGTPEYESATKRWGGAGQPSYGPQWADIVRPWDNSMDTTQYGNVAQAIANRKQAGPAARIQQPQSGGYTGNYVTNPAYQQLQQQNSGGLKSGSQGYGQNVFPYPQMNPSTTGIGITGYQSPWTQPLYPLYGTGGTEYDRMNQLYAPWNANALQNNAADYYYMMGTRYSPSVPPLMSYYPTGNVPTFGGFNQYTNPGGLMFDYSSLIPGGAWNWMAGNTGGA